MAREFRIISTSYAILLVLIGGIFIYGFLYNYMYEPEPDPQCTPSRWSIGRHSALSRQYTRLIDAAPQVSRLHDRTGFSRRQRVAEKGQK